ncbi:unnamed protein product [Ixodes pacificus]
MLGLGASRCFSYTRPMNRFSRASELICKLFTCSTSDYRTFAGSVCTDDPHAPVQLLSFGDFGGRFPRHLVPGFPGILDYGHPYVLVQETRRSDHLFELFSSSARYALEAAHSSPPLPGLGWANPLRTWSDRNN